MSEQPHVDLVRTLVAVWETGVDEDSMRRRLFDPAIEFLIARGWSVERDPDIEKNYACLGKNRRLCHKGELVASLSLAGRHLEFNIWQEKYGVTHRYGGKYEYDHRAKVPPALRRQFDNEMARLSAFWVSLTGYVVTDRRYLNESADERIARDYSESWHTDKALGRPKFTNGDRSRRSRGGRLIEHGQTAWVIDRKGGRWLRAQVFYSLNESWLVKLSHDRLEVRHSHEITVRQPLDLRAKPSGEHVAQRLRFLIEAACKARNYTKAAVLDRALLAIERKAAA